MFSIPFEVAKSVVIAKSPAEVYRVVADFSSWPSWSPWLCQEPSCPVEIGGAPGTVGHSQAWKGDFIGSGQMVLSEAVQNQRLGYDLHFLKPWKSHSRVGFEFSARDAGTQVVWTMQGTLPVFMFFMKKMMSAWVGSDYTRGLSMLKEYLETGAVLSATEVKGVLDREGLHYLGKRRACPIKDVGPAMAEDFEQLHRMVERSELPKPQQLLSVYHRFDMVSGECEYTSGFGYQQAPKSAAQGLDSGSLPQHKALRVDHQGPFRHVGNAWSAAMGCQRAKHKVNKAIPPYEIYPTDPRDTADADLATQIYVPVKR